MPAFRFDDLAEVLVATEGLHASSFGSVFGEIGGQPVHVGPGADDNGNKHVAVVVASTSRLASEATRDRWVETFDDVKRGMIDVEDEAVAVRLPFGKVSKYAEGELAARVESLAAIAAAEGRVGPGRAGARPGLVNGVPTYITESEAGELEMMGQQASTEYADLKPRWPLGILAGLLGLLVSALVWAGVAVATEREFWVLGIAAGLLIGYLTLRGMGKTNVGVQITIGILTVAAVLFGQILTVAWVLYDEFGVVDPGVVLEVYEVIISEDTGTILFALGGGLIGAWYGAKLGRKPVLEPQIEIAPAI